MWEEIAAQIGQALGHMVELGTPSSVGGGCINAAYRLPSSHGDFFVKLNDETQQYMFEAEAEGLLEMAQSQSVRVPRPLCWGHAEGQAFLVMEALELGGQVDMVVFGRQLAQMHQCHAAQYGWHRDNTIGSTPQVNTQGLDWIAFWAEHRLGFQLDLAGERGANRPLLIGGDRLRSRLDGFFPGYTPKPSLLHGDLWSGNYAGNERGEAVIFDPAVYYGDREADLAMTELFGGFSAAFYQGYNEAWALDPGYAVRKNLYNLYHILNHFNLFGGGYGRQAERMCEQLLAELG